MIGKQKCRILREIRQRIADENDIPFVTRGCGFRGECTGTCLRCEGELRYLEQQLERRAALGKKVSVAALCAGMVLSSAGCAPFSHDARPTPEPVSELSGAVPYEEPGAEPSPEIFVTTGEVAWPEEEELPGEPAPTPETIPDQMELMGDVAFVTPQEAHG